MASFVPVLPVTSIPDFVLKNESRGLLSNIANNLGTLPASLSGSVAASNFSLWRDAALGSAIVSGTMQTFASGFFVPVAGRKVVCTGTIEVETATPTASGASADIYMQIRRNDSGLDGSNGNFNAGRYTTYKGVQSNDAGGKVVFDFTKTPLVIKYGETPFFYYTRKGTTPINWEIRVTGGYDLTNDDDYNATSNCLIISDSIWGFSESGARECTVRFDGSTTGISQSILKRFFAQNKKYVRMVNIFIPSSTPEHWDTWVNDGLISSNKADYIVVNLGINSALVNLNAGLSTATGVDGTTKISLKNIIRTLVEINPNAKVSVSNLAANSQANATATISGVTSGQPGFPYNGIVRRVAYNTEIAQVVTELKALDANKYKNLHLADVNAVVNNAATMTYDGTHLNSTIGHPLNAGVVYAALIA